MTAVVELPPPVVAPPRRPRSTVSIGLLAVAATLWIWSVVRLDVGAIGNFGLLSALPVTYYLALAVLTVSMGRAIFRGEPGVVCGAHVVLLVLVVHGTPALCYETLRYSWAWQHLGLVDTLARHHVVDPHVVNLNPYQSWPGFFAAAATWLAGSHASSWVGAAQWAPVFFELLDALVLYAIFETLDADRRVVWGGVWFFAVGNWIGQDYFSPQAFALFLYLVVVLVAVRMLGRRPEMPRVLARFARPGAGGRSDDERTPGAPEPATAGVGGAVALVLLLSAAIASSHPLTPFVLAGAVAALAVARVVRVRWLPFAVGGVVVAWLVTGALGYMRDAVPSILHGLVTLGGTVDQSLARAAHADASQQLVSRLGRAEVVIVAAIAVVGFVRRVRRRRWDAAAAVLAAAPLAILLGGAYGGEALFRVYLFSLPFLAFLAAAACFPTVAHRGVTALLAFLLASTAVLSGSLFGYFGKEAWTHFTDGELRAAEYVFVDAPEPTLVIDGTSGYPIGFAGFENVRYLHLTNEPATSLDKVLAAPEPVLHDWLTDTRYARAYVVITRSQKNEADALGLLPRGALDRIERALLASSRFDVVYHDADATVFTIRRTSTQAVP